MTQIVRTPEEIFDDTKKDIYFLEFIFKGKSFTYWPKMRLIIEDDDNEAHNDLDCDDPLGKAAIIKWLQEHLPGTKWEPMAPPSKFGLLIGGIDERMCIHFDENGVKEFEKHWENGGLSIDPRFQLCCLQYKTHAKNLKKL